MRRKGRKMHDDDSFDRALAEMLAPKQTDTAEMSRAVLSRIAQHSAPTHPPLSEVITAPVPLGAGFAALLLSAMGLGYALMPHWDDPLVIRLFAELLLLGGF